MIFAWYFSARETTCLTDFSEFLDKSVGQRIVRIMSNPLIYIRRTRLGLFLVAISVIVISSFPQILANGFSSTLLRSESVGDKFWRLSPFQLKDRAAMRLTGGIRLFLDHRGQEIQGRVPVFIQQDGMEPDHIFRMESGDGFLLQHGNPSPPCLF